MIKRVAQNIVKWQIQKNVLDSKESALYQYAYESLLNQVINIFFAVIIAIVMHEPMAVFLFLVSYIPLRSFCGGHHAKTNGGCIIISAILIIAVCIIVKLVEGSSVFSILPILFAFSGILILWLTPVSAKNKPLDEKETIRYRKMSRYIWLVEATIGMIFWIFKSDISLVIAISHIILSIVMVYGEQKNRQGRKQQCMQS